MSMFTSASCGPAAGFLLAVALATISCANPPPASGIHQIEQLIGDAACSNATDCRVIGVGALACGGPAGYRAWSITRTDARTLEEAVARDAAIRREEIARAGMLSTCAVKPVPGVTCARTAERVGVGRCVLTPGGSAS